MSSESGELANSTCLSGALRGFALAVLPACERAVELDPDSVAYLDSRGVARLLIGDLQGALEDLRAALAAEKTWDEELRASRSGWVELLRAGKQPFAEGGYRDLAEDPTVEGVGWLR